jgi:flagellar biosynthesis protein FlhG
VIKGDADFEEILISINNNFYLIPGESGEEILQYKNHHLLENFYKGVEKIDDLDFLIIDTGAGIGESVRSFIEASTDTVVVTVPDPSAIMDAYAMIKFASGIKDAIYLVLNSVKNKKEAQQIAKKIEKVAQSHLKNPIRIDFLGYIQKSSLVEEASKKRELITRDYSTSIPAIQIADIVKGLTNSLTKEGEHIKNTPNLAIFFKRLLQQM